MVKTPYRALRLRGVFYIFILFFTHTCGMKQNRLALIAVLFLTAVALVCISAIAVQKQPPVSVAKERKIERLFTPKPRVKP